MTVYTGLDGSTGLDGPTGFTGHTGYNDSTRQSGPTGSLTSSITNTDLMLQCTFFINTSETDNYVITGSDLIITFNSPTLDRGGFSLVSNNQIECRTYLFNESKLLPTRQTSKLGLV